MPNHVSNRLTISGNPEAVAQLFAAIAGGEDSPCIDFNKIVPMPEVLKNTGSGSSTIAGIQVTSWWTDNSHKWNDPKRQPDRLLTEAEQSEIAATGYPNWYDWSIANRGTKWNAYSQKRFSDSAIYFETAWSVPIPILEALVSSNPGLEVKLEYADEDRGRNAGTLWFSGMERSNCELEGHEAVAFWFDLNPSSVPKEYGYDPKTWENVGEEAA